MRPTKDLRSKFERKQEAKRLKAIADEEERKRKEEEERIRVCFKTVGFDEK